MKFITTLFFFMSLLLASGSVSGQLLPSDKKKLAAKEDSLKKFARQLITDSTTAQRMISDSQFTRVLVRALQVRHSFYYPFDSVQGISRLYSPDSTFRIFTWNIQYDDAYSRQRGAIQMRTKDGTLKLFPLRDVSEFVENAEDSLRNRSNWIGAVYYNMIRKQFNGKNYYTLFGIDYNNAQSNKKWMEVLTFNEKNEPVFGGPLFSYKNDSIPRPDAHRITLEFKKDARVLMNYIEELGVILVDHLISESDEPDLKWTYVPDGDNEAFKWENGKWVHMDKAFDFKINMSESDMYLGNPPVADPILDPRGNRNDRKLEEKSDKNRQKEKPKGKDN